MSRIRAIFFDVGGPLYDDSSNYRALLQAMRERRPVSDEAYQAAYDEGRRLQQGHLGRRLVQVLLPGEDVEQVRERARQLWGSYPPEALHPDVRPTLQELAHRYRLGVIANQRRTIREAIRRDRLDPFFSAWAISEELGVEKPDPRLFRSALVSVGVRAEEALMVGDRLDMDVLPARSVGMKAAWLLRGEAPDAPTPEQLEQAGMTLRSLAGLPALLDRL